MKDTPSTYVKFLCDAVKYASRLKFNSFHDNNERVISAPKNQLIHIISIYPWTPRLKTFADKISILISFHVIILFIVDETTTKTFDFSFGIEQYWTEWIFFYFLMPHNFWYQVFYFRKGRKCWKAPQASAFFNAWHFWDNFYQLLNFLIEAKLILNLY